MARRGGTATEREGRFGTELRLPVPVQTARRPDRHQQPSRIVGINGPRWMLRATFLGRPAVEPDSAADWEDALARSSSAAATHAMPAGDPLPLTLPDERPAHDAPTAEPRLWHVTEQEPAAAQHQQVGEQRRPARPRPAQDLRRVRRAHRIADAPDRERVQLRGTLRTVTLRPRGGVPALEAELYDGSGVITVIWLGRRRIAGIAPGPGDQGRGPDRRRTTGSRSCSTPATS